MNLKHLGSASPVPAANKVLGDKDEMVGSLPSRGSLSEKRETRSQRCTHVLQVFNGCLYEVKWGQSSGRLRKGLAQIVSHKLWLGST